MYSNKLIPILSICIPTYNRGRLLNQLLQQIYDLNSITKSKLQICISDNCSNDNTFDIINEWQSKLNLITARQNTNIGASKNFQAVAALSTSPWILLAGDDDLFVVSGFQALLSLLETCNPNTWVLANISNQDGSSLLEKFGSGYISMRKFKKQILINSALDVLGFMSVHVIPRESAQRFALLRIDQIYGWPHLALLFHDLLDVNVYIQRECIVKRGGDGEEITQTWRANDWLCLMMQKTKLCCYSKFGKTIFSSGIALREYLRWPYARQTFYAALAGERKDKLFFQAIDYINKTEIYWFGKWIIKSYVMLLLMFPIKLIYFAKKLKNPNSKDSGVTENVSVVTDGIDRGL